MELKKAKLTGTTSESGLGLQHEAAMRVEARYLAEEKRRRHLLMMGRLKTILFLIFLAALLGGGYYAWHNGLWDEHLVLFGINRTAKSPAVPPANESPVAKPMVATKTEVDMSVQKMAANIDAFNEASARFAEATVSYWKDAVADDKPKKNGPALDYMALVPDAKGGFDILNVRLAGDSSMKVQKLVQTRGPVDVPSAEFNKMVESTPYLVMREGRAYYCSAGKPARQTGFVVPAKGEGFNPSRLEFGALYDLALKSKIAKPAFRYDVFLDHKQFRKKLLVATVGFGEEVSRERFEAAARSAVDDDAVVSVLLDVGKVGFAPAK